MIVNFAFSDYLVLVVYTVVMMSIGVFFSHKNQTTEGFLLGNRNVAWLAASISLVMALFSAISFTAIPGEAYKNGIRMWLGDLVVFAVVPLGMWMFVRFYYRLGDFTPYTYLERRFNASVRLIASVLYLLTRGLYLAVVLYATAKIFEGAAGVKPWKTIFFTGLLAAFIATVGGMKAVVWSNVVQFFVLVGGVIAAAIILISRIDGGIIRVFQYAFEHGRGFNFNSNFFSFNPYERVTLWWIILAMLGAYLSSFATDQITIQQLLATKDYDRCKKAAYATLPINIGVNALFWILGLSLFCFYSQQKASGIDADNVLAVFVSTQLPSPIPGLVLAGVIAAVLSTLDSGVNSLSTIIIKDIYKRFFKQDATEAQEFKTTRLASALVGVYMIVGALCITWVSSRAVSTIYEVSAIWQSLNGIVLGIFILGICSSRVDTKLVLLSSLVSVVFLLWSVWFYYYRLEELSRMSFIVVGNSGFLATVTLGFAGSIFSKKEALKNINGLTLRTIDSKLTVNHTCDSSNELLRF